MKILIAALCFMVATGSQLKAESQEVEIAAAGPFIVIQKKVGYSPLEVTALRKSLITSFNLTGRDILIRTSETEIVYTGNDKQHTRMERYLKHSLSLKDEIEAKRIFDILLSEMGSGS